MGRPFLMIPFFPNSWKLWGLSPDRLQGGPGRPGGKVARGFHQGSTRVPRGSARAAGVAIQNTACCWGYYLSLFSVVKTEREEN